MTTAIYAGGISLTSYPVVCQAVSAINSDKLIILITDMSNVSFDCDVRQVGIALHYSSLSTLLWIGVSARVIYKEAVWRMPRQPEGESPAPPTQRPMLRSVDERQLTFTNFPYHELVVCCQYGLCFGQMRQFSCMATQTAPHLSGPLYPTTIVPLFVRKVWSDITGVPVRHKKSISQYELRVGEGRNV